MRTVGRLRELELLGRVVDAAEGGAGGLAVVEGDPGIGKSHVLEVLASRAHASVVLRGRSWEEGGAPPAWPWREVLGHLRADVGWDAGRDRFALYQEIVDAIREASRSGLVLVLLDDMHAADADTLTLTRFVSRSIRELPVALIAAGRPSRWVQGLSREAVHVTLGPLSREEIVEVADDAAPLPLTPHVRREIVRLAEGVPLVARELAFVASERGAGPTALPSRLRDAVDDRVRVLPVSTQELLAAASVLGRQFALADLADLLNADIGGIVDRLGPALTARVVTQGAGRGQFSHQVIRDAVYEALPAPTRLRLHAAAAERMTATKPDARVAERARHLMAAVPFVAAADAIDLAERAAGSLQRSGNDNAAADVLLSAIELTEYPGRRLRLLLDCGDSLLRTGRIDKAQTCFDQSLSLAGELGDGEALARGLLGRTELVPSTTQAGELAGLIAHSDAGPVSQRARIRLQARYARLQMAAGAVPAARAAAAEAVDAAREIGDDHLLADVLTVQHYTLGGPDDLTAAQDVSRELAAVADRIGDPDRLVDAAMEDLIDHLRAGDITGVDRTLDRYRQLTAATGRPRHRFFLESRRAMRAFISGRLTEGAAALARAHKIGTDIEEPDTEAVFHGARVMVIADLDPDEARADADAAETLAAMTGESRLLVFAAYLRSAVGDIDIAADHVEQAIAADFSNLPRDGSWLMMMAMAAHAIARSKQARRAQTAYDLLTPYRGRVVVNDGAVTFGGVVDHYLGLLAAALGQTDRARAHLDDATAAYGRLGATLFLARANEERDELAGASPTAPTPTRRARFVLTRGEWECGYEGATFHVRNMVGLQHLARLIAASGDEVHVLQLAGADNLTGGDQSPVELLDARAKASYRQRIADLREDIDEADANNDYERTERLRAELDAIVEHLRGAVGLGGKSRSAPTDAERARVAVRKAITAALDRLAEHDTAFAQHLRIHTHTGLYCRYEPDPLHPLEWDTARRTS